MARLVIAAVLLAAACSASTGDGNNGGAYANTGANSSGGEATGASSSGGASSSSGTTPPDASVDDAADASATRPPGFIVFSCSRERGIYGSDVTETYERAGMIIDSNGYVDRIGGTIGQCPFAAVCAPCAKPGSCEAQTANSCGVLSGGVEPMPSRVCDTGPFAGMPGLARPPGKQRLSSTELAELLAAIATLETSTAGRTTGPGCAVTYGCDGQRQANGQCAPGCSVPDNGFHQGRIRVAGTAHGNVADYTEVDTFIDIHGLHVDTQLTVIRHDDPAADVIRKYNCVQGLGAVY